jgi:hypothetical protein
MNDNMLAFQTSNETTIQALQEQLVCQENSNKQILSQKEENINLLISKISLLEIEQKKQSNHKKETDALKGLITIFF